MSLLYYQRIPMETIRQGTVIPFALYCLEENRQCNVLLPGDLFSQEILFSLAKAEISDLYVRREEMDRYLVYLDRHSSGMGNNQVGEHIAMFPV